MKPLRTTCPYCGVGCGIAVVDGVPKGDGEHPANHGRLCSKGAALKDTLDLPDRLLVPTVSGQEVSWSEALDAIAREFTSIRKAHGPDAIAFYLSGQFLTEDYYVANKLMKGFIGSGNVDTNSRLCMASSVAGHVRAFGEDIVPGCYEDLEEADLVVLVGSNMAWCHPVLYQRMMAARERRGTRIVNLDPRRTATAETCDLHLATAPGSDVLLFNRLLAHLDRVGAADRDWVSKHVSGYGAAVEAATASAPSAEFVAAAAGVDPTDLRRFYDWFAGTERVVTLYSQGVNQSVRGTDKVNAILNCHLATGRIGRAGMGPFSLTGQPNAMGGREVGGLANQLAAHLDFSADNVDRVRRFWSAPHIASRPGLKAVDLFDAVEDGRIRAVWIAATNPAASMPRAGRVREALKMCPLVIVADAWPTDTTRCADIVLPAASWAEKDGTVTNSERRISRQRAFRAAPGQARPDWWMFAEVGRRMGWEQAFAYPGPADVFREHAALSCFENDGARLFDLGAFADCTSADYDALAPVQWPCPKPGRLSAGPRLFARGGFPTADGRARMIALDVTAEAARPELALTLNTGRLRDQWHTMTRTGRVPGLMTHCVGPFVALHPQDAAARGVQDGELVCLQSENASSVLRAKVDSSTSPGQIFVPMHWTDQFTSSGPVGRLVHARTDPVSGQPDLKGTPADVFLVKSAWHGLLLTRRAEPDLPNDIYWSKSPLATGYAFDLAGWTELDRVIDSEAKLRRLLRIPHSAELISYSDPRMSMYRYAGVVAGELDACVFFAPPGVSLPSRDSVASFVGCAMSPSARLMLLSGVASEVLPQRGRMVCSCFSVDERRIAEAIRAKRLRTAAEIGELLGAGTNCGSCIPELKSLLAAGQPAVVA
ncbi:MAG: molybdopterin-dependent oxidoreductase [Alphaproteobacteria bacterium]|nr:molybdopterin-dependent oxidoreductase [Alphaproteobacteria bacterium]